MFDCPGILSVWHWTQKNAGKCWLILIWWCVPSADHCVIVGFKLKWCLIVQECSVCGIIGGKKMQGNADDFDLMTFATQWIHHVHSLPSILVVIWWLATVSPMTFYSVFWFVWICSTTHTCPSMKFFRRHRMNEIWDSFVRFHWKKKSVSKKEIQEEMSQDWWLTFGELAGQSHMDDPKSCCSCCQINEICEVMTISERSMRFNDSLTRFNTCKAQAMSHEHMKKCILKTRNFPCN